MFPEILLSWDGRLEHNNREYLGQHGHIVYLRPAVVIASLPKEEGRKSRSQPSHLREIADLIATRARNRLANTAMLYPSGVSMKGGGNTAIVRPSSVSLYTIGATSE